MPRMTGIMPRASLSLMLSLIACGAIAQNYPTQPVRIISPYAPGGSTFTVARLVAEKMTEAWGYQVLVDNRPGAGTVIGTEAMVKAPPGRRTA